MKMKLKLMKCFQWLLLVVAIIGAHTPSQTGMYQPECPKELKSR